MGDEFLDEFAAGMRSLEKDPERHPPYYGAVRRVLLRRFPYKIFYRIFGESVIVYRVLHAKQDHRRQLR